MLDKILLFPYYLTLKARNSFYNKPGRKVYTPSVPSVNIGNVTAGGTGKTPHVEMIVRMLEESVEWSGKQLAVLSLGYKRESRGFQQVDLKGGALMFGDEPVQMKRKFPELVVAVDKDRVEGCKLLEDPSRLGNKKVARKCWNREFPAADYIILDDAYQYRKIKAAKNVVLVDYNRPVTKDSLLPFGRLRDLPERIYDADAVIISKCPEDLEPEGRTAFLEVLGLESYDPETCTAVNPKGERQLVFFTCIKYCYPKGVYEETEPRYVFSKKVVLITGIAKDTPLRDYLSNTYKIIKHYNLPDHHKFTWSDINRLNEVIRKNPVAAIATTEKDAQRFRDFNGMPKEIIERMLMVPIKADFLTDHEKEVFRRFIVF